MKKQIGSILMLAVLIFSTSAMASEKIQSVIPYDTGAIQTLGGHTQTAVKDDGGNVVITFLNVRLGPIGKDTQGRDLRAAEVIALYSGIMDAKGAKKPFAIAEVKNGNVTFAIPNSARVAGVPVVEHLWGRSVDEKMALVHDPNDPFVVSEGGDLQKLAVGILMHPNCQTESLKPLGKLDQGPHPELARGACN
ncbi:MAG TPA: hypothetical protein DDY52_00105 [Candidatus Moranbacteria bacterium]|nr:MAG: hypothetical protein UR51_C0011G0054 [Candidatus Moranbacteria bacterium GW2011_GWF1_34_10]HBI16550.1 hypothetical protein [Candidatus Moranbacteria bacterium]